MKIAIKFGDNDFYYTWIGVLNAIYNAGQEGHTAVPIEKAQLLKIINEISVGMYFLYQNQFRYNNGVTTQEHFDHSREYLQITEDQLLIGDEVTDYIIEVEGDDNGETFILDYGKVYSI